MPAKIPATVVTGFLGAGKTTLIRHLLTHAEGRRIALVINEFGDLGVDGEILKGCGDIACREEDLVELSNGCICCAVADEFVPTIERLIARETPPDHIVIETSGLALPQPLLRAFQWPGIRPHVTLDGVVAVVDGPAVASGAMAADPEAVDRQRAADESLSHATSLADLFEDQIASADLLVVSKADLLGTAAAEALGARLAATARPSVRAVSAAQGVVDPAVLLGLGLAVEDDLEAREAPNHHHHHDHDHDHHHHDHHHDHGHDAFETFVVDLPEVPSREAVIARVEATLAAHPILRLKGFAAVAGKPARLLLQAVGPRLDARFDRPWGADEPRRSRLVVIGPVGLDRAGIVDALAGTEAVAAE